MKPNFSFPLAKLFRWDSTADLRCQHCGFWSPQFKLLVKLKTYIKVLVFLKSKCVGMYLSALELKVN